MSFSHWHYQGSRWLGKSVTRLAAAITLDRMPPFVGAAGLIERDGHILLIRDPAQHQLVLPGGHLRWSESVEAGMCREVWEETGFAVMPTGLVGLYSGVGAPVDRGIVRVVMTAEIVGGSQRGSSEGEVVWVPVPEAAAGRYRDARVIGDWVTAGSRPSL